MDDGIAIVGMGCRLPGDVKSPSQFWELLTSGRSTQSDVPPNRFDINNWCHPDSKRFGAIVSRGGYFLGQDDSYCEFDPSFFGIHPLEASSMDPQQRKLLEVVYETFESAGTTLDKVSGSKTACYVGAFTHDYKTMNTRDVEDYLPYFSTGSDMTVLSNRVNYVFNLKGPSLTVDTACSSSLYALHLACQGLRAHDFDAAVVAGTSIIMDVRFQIIETKLGIASPTSTCHTFDESADGFGRAEGITAIYIKRLKDAYRDQDPIRAIIRSSAINSNGKGLGITQPGVTSQEEVTRQAYAKAGLKFNDTGYVECHGTGTPVGDPIEVEAIGRCFAEGRTSDTPLLLSALKSQIGHTEGASGVAGVQKAVLSLENSMIPATVGVTRINSALNLRSGKLKVVRKLEPWPAYLNYRRASVNSFGYGGANAHIVIDSTESFFSSQLQLPLHMTWTCRNSHHKDVKIDAVTEEQSGVASSSSFLLVTSAHNPKTLQSNIACLSGTEILDQASDLAFSLASKRSRLHHRAFSVATSKNSGTCMSEWRLGSQQTKPPVVAFVFTGQGAQWPRMGIELVQSFQVFRSTFTELQGYLDSIQETERPSWTLYQALSASAEDSLIMKDVLVSVTLCAAIQIALVNLLRSWQVNPVAVVGHSSGETAAAYCAGYLTASEAILTSYYRSLSQTRNHEAGLMMAVGAGAEQAGQLIKEERDVYLACHNSPKSVTIAGQPSSIETLQKRLQSQDIFARIVKSSGFANHCPLVQKAADQYLEHFSFSVGEPINLASRAGSAALYSCVTGEKIDRADVGASHWSKNLAGPVLFDEALQKLLRNETAVDLLIEIGPHPALAGPIRQIKESIGGSAINTSYLPTLTRGANSVVDLLNLAGALFNIGYPLDLDSVNRASSPLSNKQQPKFIVDLPNYQWSYSHDIKLAEQRLSRETRFRKHPRHDLLGSLEVVSTPDVMIWRNRLSLNEVTWMKDHLIGTSVLFPASAYIAMAVEAMTQYSINAGLLCSSYEFKNVDIMRPLVLIERNPTELVFEFTTSHVTTTDSRHFNFRVSSVSSTSQWTQHATGECSFATLQDTKHVLARPHLAKEQNSLSTSYNIYAEFRKVGLKYGCCFRPLLNVCLLENQAARADIDLQPTKGVMTSESRYLVHPATMDGCLQAAFAASVAGVQSSTQDRAFLPKQILYMKINNTDTSGTNALGKILSTVEKRRPRSIDAKFLLSDADNSLLIDGAVRLQAADGISSSRDVVHAMPEPYQRVVWAADVDYLNGKINFDEILKSTNTLRMQDHGKSDSYDSSVLAAQSPKLAGGNTPSSLDNGLSEAKIENGSLRWHALSAIIQLLSFKKPSMRYLEVGMDETTVWPIMEAVHGHSRYPLCSNITFLRTGQMKVAHLNEVLSAHPNVNASCSESNSEEIDVIVVTNTHGSLQALRNSLIENTKHLSNTGYILIACQEAFENSSSTQTEELLQSVGILNSRICINTSSVMLVQAESPQAELAKADCDPQYWVIYQQDSMWVTDFLHLAKSSGTVVHALKLTSIDLLPQGAKAISLLEVEQPLLTSLSQEKLANLQKLLTTASSVEWIYSAYSDTSLFPGMVRTLRMEMPLLKIRCIQIGTDPVSRMSDTIVPPLKQLLFTRSTMNCEDHVIIRDGRILIMRYVIDETQNLLDMARTTGIIEHVPFDRHMCLATPHTNQDTYNFVEDATLQDLDPKDSMVRIQPLIYGMSTQNAHTLRGQNQDRWFSHECFGRVVVAGRNSPLKMGDLVLHYGGSMIRGEEIVDSSSCVPCKTEEEGRNFVLLLEHFCIAYYCLMEAGRVQSGQFVIVNSKDATLLSVFQIFADYLGIVLLRSEAQGEKYAITNFLGKLDESQPRAAERHESLSTPMPLALLIDTVGDLTLACLHHHVGPTTKFVRVGMPQLFSTSAAADLSFAHKGVSISYFDPIELADSEPLFLRHVLANSIRLARETAKESQMPSPTTFSIAKLAQAMTCLSSAGSNIKIGLVREPGVPVPVIRIHKGSLRLRSDGAYLLVGCLGGLGRSITNWLYLQGARRFVFLSRSGADKAEARDLLDKLCAKHGVSAEVIQGNVTSREDVQKAVASARLPIRGVIQAATVFDECHFKSMNLDQFNRVIEPKVHGTVNLHEATLNQPLDFFVMTSSSIGITGATTQSHYAAANAFMDGFAQYRRGLGLPACSLSLGMVVGIGHVHDEGLEDVLGKRGVYAISEVEFLRMMELACSGGTFSSDQGLRRPFEYDPSFIVTGLDPTKYTDLATLPEWVVDDPVVSHIAHIARRLSPDSKNDQSADGQSPIRSLRTLLSNTKSEDDQIVDALQVCIIEKFSSLISIAPTDLEASIHRPLSDLGLDSIISADFQTWARRELKVPIDFMEMLAGNQTIANLTTVVKSRLRLG